MLYTNFTNYYRYDHIFRKPDIIYEYEKIKKNLNIANKTKENDIIKKYELIGDKIISIYKKNYS